VARSVVASGAIQRECSRIAIACASTIGAHVARRVGRIERGVPRRSAPTA
jgi:hypothetical protein